MIKIDSVYNFSYTEALKLKEYQELEKQGEAWQKKYKNIKTPYEIWKIWGDICDKKNKIKNEIEEKYKKNMFYKLENFLELGIGYYNNKFYIINLGNDGYSPEEQIIFFESKKELVEYLNLDKLLNELNKR